MLTAQKTEPIQSSLLGMILFISSEIMFFGALFGSYFTLRATAAQWPPAGTPEIGPLPTALFTIALVASSFTQHLGVVAIRKDDHAGLTRWMLVTIGLGAVFLLGQGLEYASLAGEGFRLGSNVFATLFFAMTGFHGLHVLAGLAALAIVAVKSTRGHLSRRRHGAAEAVGYYWHFVDVVWIGLFATLYLLQ